MGFRARRSHDCGRLPERAYANEWLDAFGFGGRDPMAGREMLARRGWLGSHLQNYNLAPLVRREIRAINPETPLTFLTLEDHLSTLTVRPGPPFLICCGK